MCTFLPMLLGGEEGWQLLSSVLHYEQIAEHKDKESRFVLTTGKIDDILITLINVYAPPGSDWTFYRHIFEKTVTKCQGVLICTGDFNVRSNPNLDLSNGKSNTKKSVKESEICERKLDCWM